MVDAAGVELDTRFQTGRICEFPNENESLKPLKFGGAGTKTGTTEQAKSPHIFGEIPPAQPVERARQP